VNGPAAPIDYTNVGYAALRESMLALARDALPEWTDFSEGDLGVLLVELVAYAADLTLYYQTRIANNLLPATADEPEALVQLLRFIGYELQPPAPATVGLMLAFEATQATPVTVPAGTQFTAANPAGQQVTFETQRDVTIQDADLLPADPRQLRWTKPYVDVSAVEGQTTKAEQLGISDGSPNQSFTLKNKPVVADSIRVSVAEQGPSGPVYVWLPVETLADSQATDRHWVPQRDADRTTTVVFGDGVNGMIPPKGTATAPVTISADYRVGGGPQGNLPPKTRFASNFDTVQDSFNPAPAAGGTAGEDFNRARTFAPRLFRAQDRAVTLQDYVDLALRVPGVGKARAVSPGWNQVALYVAPTGEVGDPSELLQRNLLQQFESRRMATTQVVVLGPQPADVFLAARVQAQPFVLQSAARSAVEAAVADLLSFDANDFGQKIYLSRIYDAIQNLEEVVSLTVVKFSRTPDLPANILTRPDVIASGVIELAPNELPRPGYQYRGPFDLQLLSLSAKTDIPGWGTSLVVVADVSGVLYFRIFDANGKVVVDTDETQLTTSAGMIGDLKARLVGLRPPYELTGSDKEDVIAAVTSIVGYTDPFGGRTPTPIITFIEGGVASS
jgi:uncharacterized phage protein gp47/JayE